MWIWASEAHSDPPKRSLIPQDPFVVSVVGAAVSGDDYDHVCVVCWRGGKAGRYCEQTEIHEIVE